MIKNISKNKVIAKRHNTCKSIFSKATGLMFSKEKKNFGLVFEFKKEQITSLHMFFEFYPIDVLFLDKNMKVVEKKEKFLPFTFYFPKKKAKTIIEFNAGSCLDTNIGDKIKINQ